jgi:micrococcal nuclease
VQTLSWRGRRLPVALLGVLLAVIGAAPHAAAPERGRHGDVVRVVDGDTIHVRVGERVEKVRYIGVNTPELRHPTRGEEPGGQEATAINRALVDGRRVRLELDVQERDRYQRLLAYVWVGERMVNAELLRRGYAQVMTVPPNVRHQQQFLGLERQARAAGRGLWRRTDAGRPAAAPAGAPAGR